LYGLLIIWVQSIIWAKQKTEQLTLEKRILMRITGNGERRENWQCLSKFYISFLELKKT